MDGGGVRTAIVDSNLHKQIDRTRFGILHEHIKIAIIIKYGCIKEFKLRLLFVTATILLDEPKIRELVLGILVEHFQIRVRRRGVEIVIEFLYIFAMIAFAIGQTEKTLLQNGIAA